MTACLLFNLVKNLKVVTNTASLQRLSIKLPKMALACFFLYKLRLLQRSRQRSLNVSFYNLFVIYWVRYNIHLISCKTPCTQFAHFFLTAQRKLPLQRLETYTQTLLIKYEPLL